MRSFLLFIYLYFLIPFYVEVEHQLGRESKIFAHQSHARKFLSPKSQGFGSSSFWLWILGFYLPNLFLGTEDGRSPRLQGLGRRPRFGLVPGGGRRLCRKASPSPHGIGKEGRKNNLNEFGSIFILAAKLLFLFFIFVFILIFCDFIWCVQVLVSPEKLFPRDADEEEHGGVDDMTKLTYLHEPGVLYNLQRRYALNDIYVRVYFYFRQ